MFFYKLKLLLQKFFFQLVLVGAVLGFVGVFVFAVKLDKANQPPANLQSEFGSQSAKPVVKGATSDAPANPLSIQHMSADEISLHLTEVIAESLSFNRDNYKASAADMQKYFTPEGYTQYQQFLLSSGFEATFQSQDLQSGAYVEQGPLELAHGLYGGVFKWVFEVPVTISFIPRNAETYRNGQTKAQNRRFLLRAQFARAKDSDPNAIKIELWQALPPRS